MQRRRFTWITWAAMWKQRRGFRLQGPNILLSWGGGGAEVDSAGSTGLVRSEPAPRCHPRACVVDAPKSDTLHRRRHSSGLRGQRYWQPWGRYRGVARRRCRRRRRWWRSGGPSHRCCGQACGCRRGLPHLDGDAAGLHRRSQRVQSVLLQLHRRRCLRYRDDRCAELQGTEGVRWSWVMSST